MRPERDDDGGLRVCNLALVSASVTRHIPIPPEGEAPENLQPDINATTSIAELDDADNMYVVSLSMAVNMQAETGCALSATAEYEAIVEATSGRLTLEDVQNAAAALLSPYTSQFVSDLALRAGMPAFFMPPLDFRAPAAAGGDSLKLSPTIQ